MLCLVIMATMTEARYPQGVLYPFTIDSILQCRRPNPDVPGEIVDQGTPTLPLVPGPNDEVWLPPEISFRAPPGTIDVVWLRPLLPELNMTDTQFETSPPPSTPTGNPVGSGQFPPVDTTMRTRTQLDNIPGFTETERDIIINWWDRISFPSCDDAMNVVAELPDYYWPKFFVSGRCSGNPCSLPRGQSCLPSSRNTVLVPVVRWDCCWDYGNSDDSENSWQWACGWRRVNVQVVTQCYCACRPILS